MTKPKFLATVSEYNDDFRFQTETKTVPIHRYTTRKILNSLENLDYRIILLLQS